MCVLILTRGDGTPFDATSIQEEDIIELCVEMGQTHPKGVPWFLLTELVVCFIPGIKLWSWHAESPKPQFCTKNPFGFILLPSLPPI